jgi:hypothetical protein
VKVRARQVYPQVIKEIEIKPAGGQTCLSLSYLHHMNDQHAINNQSAWGPEDPGFFNPLIG